MGRFPITILLVLSLLTVFGLASCGGGSGQAQPERNTSGRGTVPPLSEALAAPAADPVDARDLANSWKGELDGVIELNGAAKRYGYFDHDYLIDTQLPVKVHNYGAVSVVGEVTNAIFTQRSSWLEIGLVNKGTADAALFYYEHPPYMFNQSAFLGCNLRSDGKLQVWPSDYDGQPYTADPSWTVAPGSDGKFNFNFEVKLVPNGKKDPGGLLYLSVNGAPFGQPVTYGQENWMWFWGNDYHYPIEFVDPVPGYDLPTEKAYITAQAYTEKSTAYIWAEVSASLTKEE